MTQDRTTQLVIDQQRDMFDLGRGSGMDEQAWIDDAMRSLRQWLSGRTGEFLFEAFRTHWVCAGNESPSSYGWWSKLARAAADAGYMRKTGNNQMSTSPRNRSHRYSTWESLLP